MGFYERVMGLEIPRLRVHTVRASVAEFKRGTMTALQARTALGLNAAETTELQTLANRVGAATDPLTVQEVEDVLILAQNQHPPLDTVAAVKTRLGV